MAWIIDVPETVFDVDGKVESGVQFRVQEGVDNKGKTFYL